MTRKARARMEWLTAEEGGRRRPFCGGKYSTAVHFAEDPQWPNEAWSLVAEFENPLNKQNPTEAEVWFLVDEAPHELLHPGSRFELLEGLRVVARGEVTQSCETCTPDVGKEQLAASRSG